MAWHAVRRNLKAIGRAYPRSLNRDGRDWNDGL